MAMIHVLNSLSVKMHRPQSRFPARLRLNPTRDSNRCFVVCPRAISKQVEDEEEDPFSDGDDEVCGVDFITLEPITGAECRRLREEETLLKSHAAAVAAKEQETAAAAAAAAASESQNFSRGSDGYDFFGRTRLPLNKINPEKSAIATSNKVDTSKMKPAAVLPLQSPYLAMKEPAAKMTDEYRNSNNNTHNLMDAAAGGSNGIRPSYRASPLFEEFQRQRDTSTAAKILFLDEGGEFRAALGAALLRHMLSRLRTSLDVTIECASLGPIDGRKLPSRDLQRTAAAMGISLNPAAASRQFQEVADAVRYDLILVMDRFDYQEVIREVSMLDAINPGGNYSGRVRVLGPFGMAARRASPGQIVQDISDPLYDMHTDSDAEQAALHAAAQELAFACRGLATYLLDLQAKCGQGVTLRGALAQSLRCPLLAGELPSQRERNCAVSCNAQDDFFTVRAVNGQRRVVRRPAKPRGYWKNVENIENELRLIMKSRNLDRLPTQKELRATGMSSLATAIDAHGGLAEFSTKLGVAMASRRPNGYWNNFENLARALKAYLKPVQNYYPEDAATTKTNSNGSTHTTTASGSFTENELIASNSKNKRFDGDGLSNSNSEKFWMPSAQDLTAAGRGDLLRAIREHGGIVAVAKKLGVKVRRGSGWDEAKILQELRSFAAAAAAGKRTSGITRTEPLQDDASSATLSSIGNSLPTKEQLILAGRGDIVAAVHKLGGFQYFRQLDHSTRNIRRSSEPNSKNNDNMINGSSSNGATETNSISAFSIKSPNSKSEGKRSAPISTKGGDPSSSSSSSSGAFSILPASGRKLPLIEEVADQIQHWMSTSNQFSYRHRIPTRAELVGAGRSDLWSAVQRCGGGRRVAEYMGLEWIETRGRRKKYSEDGEEGSSTSGSESDGSGGDPRGEIHMLDAYEEFVFI